MSKSKATVAKRVIPDLVRQFAQDASFQFQQRDKAAYAQDTGLEYLAEMDERLEAQLDALRMAGAPGWELAKEELSWKEPGEVFVAALLAFETGDEERIAAVAEAAAAAPGLPRALIAGLGWMSWDAAKTRIESLSASESPILRFAAVGGAAAHRQWLPALMKAALKDADPPMLSRALKACGEMGRKETLPEVVAQLKSKDEGCRFRAQWASLLLGRKESAVELLAWGLAPGPFRLAALQLALRAIPLADALTWIGGLPKTETRLRLQCLGWAGAAAHIPWILKQIAKPELARPAGAALTWITGVQFKSSGLGAIPPDGVEDQLDEAGLVEPGDSDLPWPDAAKTEAWWKSAEAKFPAAKAFAFGRVKGDAAFKDMLAEGNQCYRLGAALESALLLPGKPILECRTRKR